LAKSEKRDYRQLGIGQKPVSEATIHEKTSKRLFNLTTIITKLAENRENGRRSEL